MAIIELGARDRNILKEDADLTAIRAHQAAETPPTPAAPTTTVVSAALEIQHILGEATQAATGEDSDDIIDLTSHGYDDGDRVKFTALTGGSSLAVDTEYFVIESATNTFQIADEPAGDALDFGSDITAATITRLLPLDVTHLEVHVGTSSGFTPDQTTYVGDIPAAASVQKATFDPVVRAYIEDSADRYVKVIAVNVAGRVSTASAQTGPHNVTGGGDLYGNWNGPTPANLAGPFPAQWVDLDGSGYATTPDGAGWTISGADDLSLEFSGYPSGGSWRPSSDAMLLGQWGASGQFSYQFMLETDGTLTLNWSTDGSATLSKSSTTVVSASDIEAVAVSLDLDNGASGHDVKFFSKPVGGSYSQLGSTVTTAGTTSLHNSTATPSVGGTSSGGDAFVGYCFYAKYFDKLVDFSTTTTGNKIGEPIFQDGNQWPDDGPNDDRIGNTWTLQGTATIDTLTGYALDASVGAIEAVSGVYSGGDIVLMSGGLVTNELNPSLRLGDGETALSPDGNSFTSPLWFGLIYNTDRADQVTGGFMGFHETTATEEFGTNIRLITPTLDDTTDDYMEFRLINTSAASKAVNVEAHGTLTANPEFRFDSETSYPWRLILRNGDLDSYMVSDAADELNFYAGGAEMLALVEGSADYVHTVAPLRLGTGSTAEISGGVLTITESYHIVDGQNSASDDLDTITGHIEGSLFLMRGPTGGITVTVKDGTGNIETQNSEDVPMASFRDWMLFAERPNGNWGELCRHIEAWTTWHSGNDGTGSGLDADTVDGSHASAFAAASHVGSAVATGHTHTTSSHSLMPHSGHHTGSTASAATMRHTGDTTYVVSTSMEAIKENIWPVLSGDTIDLLDPKRRSRSARQWENPVLDLVPVIFDSVANGDEDRSNPFVGLIAEHVEKVFPWAATHHRDGKKWVVDGWDTDIVVAALLAKVKEQEQRISQLEGTLG